MRGFVPEYEIQTLPSLQDTLKALSSQPEQWKVFAGGTDLMVVFEAGKLKQKKFLNLSTFSELKGIQVSANEIRIGALTTYTQIQSHPELQKEFPLMIKSGWVTGAKAIQNRGTIGGNIANASPAADTPPSLLAYGAKVILRSEKGSRTVEYNQFHKDYKKTEMRSDEIIEAVILPRNQSWTHHYYRKVGTRAFQSISKIALSAAAEVMNGKVLKVQIGMASVGPMPLRATDLEKLLLSQNLTQLRLDDVLLSFEKSIKPIDDIRSTGHYRLAVAGRVAEQFIHSLTLPAGVYSF